MIPVTKPFLPPKHKFDALISEAWDRNWLTNNGPLINKLELKLKDYFDAPHFLLVLNGTIALQLAFKALKLKGKFITTPFSYIATVSSGVWEGLEPVFVDIDPETFNINTDLIEDKITDDVSCIVATHVFGNPCEVEKIEAIAARQGIPVIYDAAHAFGVEYKKKSLINFGDVSTLSLHATKLYHMWYIFGQRWIDDEGESEPQRVYKIGHATSEDGFSWIREEKAIISDRLHVNECQALPTVVKILDTFHMFFCFRDAVGFRTDSDKAYRIGHAYSKDLRNWVREDDVPCISTTEDSWDSDMMCYPCAFQIGNETYLLYNGNEFGKHGFGLAKLEM